MKRTISELYQADYSAGPPALITRQNREKLAPFVLFDAGGEKRESQLVIDWHPHSGVATITLPYGCDLHHEDSSNNSGVVKDGGFQWMGAGGGIWHREAYQPKAGFIGIHQLWIQLPPELESGPVEYFNMQPEDVAINGNTRVLFGEFNGVISSASAPIDITYLDVTLEKGESWLFQPPLTHTRGFIFPRIGSVEVDQVRIAEQNLGLFTESSNAIEVNSNAGASFVIALAAPSRFPLVHEYGQMHTNHAALKQAKLRIAELSRAFPLAD